MRIQHLLSTIVLCGFALIASSCSEEKLQSLCADVVCEQRDDCLQYVCEAASGQCVVGNPVPDTTTCTLADPCITKSACVAGLCQPIELKSCDDDNPCTDDTCNSETGACDTAVNTSTCDDGDACTQLDVCQNGTCTGNDPIACEALSSCHNPGLCDPSTGACTTPIKADGSACEDGDLCSTDDICTEGQCQPGPYPSCDDAEECTTDSCDPETGACVWETIESCNHPPTPPVVRVSPAPPQHAQSIECEIVEPSVDPDGDNVEYIFKWYKDGEAQAYVDPIIPEEVIAPCELWTCEVTPSDGARYGEPAFDETRVIAADICQGCIDTTTLAGDTDIDGILDAEDNCPEIYNPLQADADADGSGDRCDLCWLDGPTPPVMPDTLDWAGVQITNANFRNGISETPGTAIFEPGQNIEVGFDYQVVGASCDYCPGCVTQYMAGVTAGDACLDNTLGDRACFTTGGSGCYGTYGGAVPSARWVKDAYSGSSPGDTNSNPNGEFLAPEQPGTYFIGLRRSWHYSCHQGNMGYRKPAENTFFLGFCVLPPDAGTPDEEAPEDSGDESGTD